METLQHQQQPDQRLDSCVASPWAPQVPAQDYSCADGTAQATHGDGLPGKEGLGGQSPGQDPWQEAMLGRWG